MRPLLTLFNARLARVRVHQTGKTLRRGERAWGERGDTKQLRRRSRVEPIERGGCCGYGRLRPLHSHRQLLRPSPAGNNLWPRRWRSCRWSTRAPGRSPDIGVVVVVVSSVERNKRRRDRGRSSTGRRREAWLYHTEQPL